MKVHDIESAKTFVNALPVSNLWHYFRRPMNYKLRSGKLCKELTFFQFYATFTVAKLTEEERIDELPFWDEQQRSRLLLTYTELIDILGSAFMDTVHPPYPDTALKETTCPFVLRSAAQATEHPRIRTARQAIEVSRTRCVLRQLSGIGSRTRGIFKHSDCRL
jgi:hypothetical protein